jgi:elongation factor G
MAWQALGRDFDVIRSIAAIPLSKQFWITGRQPGGFGLETISQAVEVDFTHKRQVGGGGEFAKVLLRMEPLSRGSGVQFVNEVRAGALPDFITEGAEEGIREAAQEGVLGSGPVVDVKVTLIDGVYHELDSTRHTFRLAALGAFRRGMWRAGPRLLPT